MMSRVLFFFFFFQAEDGIRDYKVTGVQTCALPICVERRSDLAGALEHLKPRERELLWLAYVEGSSHKEIAEIAGVRAASVRLLLFRARRKLAELLRKRGCSAAL